MVFAAWLLSICIDKPVVIEKLVEALDKNWPRTPVLLQRKKVGVLISGSGNSKDLLNVIYVISLLDICYFSLWYMTLKEHIKIIKMMKQRYIDSSSNLSC